MKTATVWMAALLACGAGWAQNPQQQYPPQQYPPQQQYPQQQYPQSQGPPQAYPDQGPVMAPGQLDQVVQRIALYPDPLLAQILTAATYSKDIPEAAAWADQHNYLAGQMLSDAIAADRLPWDPSVLALLPFPGVLHMMASDPGWTQALGNAVLTERPMVMDAVQRERQMALDYGYLQSNAYERVIAEPGAIEILPPSPGVLYVPSYDPYIVFARPRRGYVGGVLQFGPAISIGAAFAPYGWSEPRLGWREHTIVIDRHPWGRTYENRDRYVHSYEHGYRRPEGPRTERHFERDRRDRH